MTSMDPAYTWTLADVGYVVDRVIPQSCMWMCNRFREDANTMNMQTNMHPSIVIYLVDHLGFADLGSYCSHLLSHNIDELAENGIRCTQMYN